MSLSNPSNMYQSMISTKSSNISSDSGTDVSDVYKLCDLHSSLFHGMTEEEYQKYTEGFTFNILKLDILNTVELVQIYKKDIEKLKEILN